MALRSLPRSKSLGVMITASHNDWRDNGVKVAVDGHIPNVLDEKKIVSLMLDVQDPPPPNTHKAPLTVGVDNRYSSLYLCRILCLGWGGSTRFIGLCSTPQLHLFSSQSYPNHKTFNLSISDLRSHWTNNLTLAYESLLHTPKRQTLHVDCSNGVASIVIEPLVRSLNYLTLVLHNTGGGTGGGKEADCNTILNEKCGSEYVQKSKKPPKLYDSSDTYKFREDSNNDIWCSVDGDVDRIVFYKVISTASPLIDDASIKLFDGDRLTCLVVKYLKRVTVNLSLNIGAVQTGYANGASTRYLEDVLKVRVLCTKTGVKHLHEAASKFDVGVYFEANGHGSVVFSPYVLKLLTFDYKDERLKAEVKILKNIVKLCNEYVGCAVADMLLCLVAVDEIGWDGVEEFYADLVSSTTKFFVADKNLVECNGDETKVLQPKGMQEELDEAMREVGGGGRCFVRKSNTEDCVRIYAEGEDDKVVRLLEDKVRVILGKFLGEGFKAKL
ncbi:hypothetical protein TrVE_jg6810 [Triparma verrucosa]|uniref:Phosphoacetylglucosamine mutase n=1 Tax=Triparma verrucosa TaxID=1606542 RepID=A0A9W7ETP7_9STRA|nr:hypothetical protein TrVE_jg6810 [Triparma verrucosa]